jgi:hypothetical protein
MIQGKTTAAAAADVQRLRIDGRRGNPGKTAL